MDLQEQILVPTPRTDIVPADTWLRCRKKLLNTLSGVNTVLLSYANGKIAFLSANLESWNMIDFDGRRRVTDIILSQVQAASGRVSCEWKI